MQAPAAFFRWFPLLLCSVPLLTAREWRVTVPAADVARAGLVVELELPPDLPSGLQLRDALGRSYAWQRDETGRGSFVVAEQLAGTALELVLTDAAAPLPPMGNGLENPEDGPARFVFGGRERAPVAYWDQERPLPRPDIDPLYRRSGFIHPVLTPAGVRVTDSYAAGHLHHHGIWSPWTRVRFQGRDTDFWNMGQGKGKVEVTGEPLAASVNAVLGRLVTHHRFVDLTAPEPITALHETWELTVYSPNPHAVRPAHVFDLLITQTCATSDPVILPEYHYGGLGYRGHEQWNGADRAFFLTSEGVTDREQAHGTRARWCHVGGIVDGRLVGTAILGHPANFRAPQPMRIHPNEPFFCYAPSQLGDWQINPGEPYVARYRFVVMDGAPDRALLDAYWNGFAQPAKATVVPAP